MSSITVAQALAYVSESSPLRAVIAECLHAQDAREHSIELYDGDTVKETLEVGENAVVVVGNLTVKGLLRDNGPESGGLLVVLGSLQTGALLTGGDIVVEGTVDSAGVVCATSAGTGRLHVGGDVRAECFFDDDHQIEVAGVIDASVLFDSRDCGKLDVIDCDSSDLKPFVTGRVLKNGLIEWPKLVKHSRSLKSVLKTGSIEKVKRRRIAQTKVFDGFGDDTQSLYINERRLRVLPPGLDRFHRLSTLNLAHNALSSLPDEIVSLTKLQTLDLSNNRLKTFPDVILELTGLEHLKLDFNQSLTSVPPSISALGALKTLGLARCTALTELPDTISSLANLESLDLTEAGLRALPESIGALTALTTLSLTYCHHLRELPASFVDLAALETCHLAAPIESFPDGMERLESLRLLQLSARVHEVHGVALRSALPACEVVVF